MDIVKRLKRKGFTKLANNLAAKNGVWWLKAAMLRTYLDEVSKDFPDIWFIPSRQRYIDMYEWLCNIPKKRSAILYKKILKYAQEIKRTEKD